MDEQVLQNSGTVLMMTETEESNPDDIAYLLQGTGLDRDKKCKLKNLAKGIVVNANLPDFEIAPSVPGAWGGSLIGVATKGGPVPLRAYKIKPRDIVECGLTNMERRELPRGGFVPTISDAGGDPAMVPVKFLGGGVKVIYFGVNSLRPSEVQTYAIQPEDRELIVLCEAQNGATLPSITGIAHEGLIVRMTGGLNWGGSNDIIGRIYGGVQFPDMELTLEVLRGYTHSVMFLGNDDYGWYRELGNSPDIGSSNTPELVLNKIKKLTDIFTGGDSLTETYPSSTSNQRKIIEFFSGVYHNFFHVKKGGVRVDHGFEMVKRETPPPEISENLVTRIYANADNELIWEQGKDSQGFELGKMLLSATVENSWFVYAWDAPNAGEGALWCQPVLAITGVDVPVNLSVAPQMSESRGAKVAITAELLNTPSAGAEFVVRVYLRQFFADGGSATPVPCDITLRSDGTSGIIGGSANTASTMVIHPGAGIKISQVSILSNPSSVNVSALRVTFGIQTFRAAT